MRQKTYGVYEWKVADFSKLPMRQKTLILMPLGVDLISKLPMRQKTSCPRS